MTTDQPFGRCDAFRCQKLQCSERDDNLFFLPFPTISGVGTTFSSCCDKDSPIIFTTGRLPDVKTSLGIGNLLENAKINIKDIFWGRWKTNTIWQLTVSMAFKGKWVQWSLWQTTRGPKEEEKKRVQWFKENGKIRTRVGNCTKNLNRD
jgi:hypothetical protein